MNPIYRRLREQAARARGALRGAAGWRRPRSRTQVIVAALAVTVLAVGVGVVWGIAGATDQRVGTAREPLGDPQSPPGGTTGGALDGLSSPGAVTGGGDPSGGSGSGLGAGSGSGTGPGGGPGSSGGGGPGNRPPVIEDPGLSSDGLILTVAPTVSDPDGDQVRVEVTADGQPVGMSGDPPRGTVAYPYQTYGAEPEASVTIVVTDAGGASAQETVSHQLRAVTTVTLQDVRFTLSQPNNCFGDVRARRLVGTLILSGPVRETVSFNEELRLDRTAVTLLDSREGTGSGAPAESVILSADLAGQRDTHDETHRDRRTVFKAMFTATDGCRGLLSYSIAFQRR
jgi:hypothetical protein